MCGPKISEHCLIQAAAEELKCVFNIKSKLTILGSSDRPAAAVGLILRIPLVINKNREMRRIVVLYQTYTVTVSDVTLIRRNDALPW